MYKEVTGFIGYCRNKIKTNNIRIKKLRTQITEYETIIDIITKTDINNLILQNYRAKIEKCFNKIDTYMEENRHHGEMIISVQKVNKTINNKRRIESYGN